MKEKEIAVRVGGWVRITISVGGELPYANKPFKTFATYRFNHGPDASYEKWHETEIEATEHADYLLAESKKLHRGQEPPNYR